MLCKSCNTQVPKRAKKCPKCGAPVLHESKNIRVVAIFGAIIAFVGGLLPFVQFKSLVEVAFGFMNGGQIMRDTSQYLIEDLSWLEAVETYAALPDNSFGAMFWYIYMALLLGTIILCALKLEKYSLITTIGAAITAVVYYFVIQDAHLDPRIIELYTKTQMKEVLAQMGLSADEIEALKKSARYKKQLELAGMPVSDLLKNGIAEIGCGVYVTIVGIIIAIGGVFVDILKYFKKEMANANLVTNRHSTLARMYTYRWFYLMFLPVIIFVGIFNYLPMLGLRYSFTVYMVPPGVDYYAGIYQFVQAFGEGDFWRAFKNTFAISIVNLILSTFIAVIISLMLNEIVTIGFKKSVQTVIYLPHFMSWVVAASIFRLLLTDSGLINSILDILNVTREPIKFLNNSDTWRPTYYFINLWKNVGWGTILYLATLSGISPDLYEAAQIDGANRWKRMLYITMPSLSNTIITVLILNLAKIMNLFESVFVLINTSVVDVAQVVQTYVYDKTFGMGVPDYGYTTTVGLIRSLTSMLLVLVCNYASKKVRGRGIV